MIFPIWMKKNQRIFASLFSLLAAMGIASVIHLNLSYFYLLSHAEKILIWAVTWTVIILIMQFVNRVLIFPYMPLVFRKPNYWYLTIMILTLISVTALNSSNYWAHTVEHNLELCFDAKNAGEALKVQKLIDPNTNFLYSPESMGIKNYPILIKTGTCLQGKILTLYPRYFNSFLATRLLLEIGPNPPSGRLYMEVNGVPAVINFDEAAIEPKEEIFLNEGFDTGSPILMPWRRTWFFGLKLIALCLNAVYLSLLFFGITERIRNNQAIC